MADKDMFNLILAESQDSVDACNREFYGRFNYPSPPMTFPSIADPKCWTVFLNQELGDWSHSRIPRTPKIWVAGCGTNQAVFTALRYPEAEVLGTDISTQSLATCQKSASQLGIKNLRLEEQTLNAASYKDEFHYIICTGVIHHNADPRVSLAKLSDALKQDGILELMIYNYYHRLLTTAYQKAIRLLFSGQAAMNLDSQLSLTRELIDHFPIRNSMREFLQDLKDKSEAYIADSLLQPVEHSYTIESMDELLKNVGLEFWLPCINQFDKAAGRLTWNMEFDNEPANRYYEVLSDAARWQIGNLLMIENSPMLWFYVQRTDSRFKRKSEKEVCYDFLKTKFEKYHTTFNNYMGGDGTYRLIPKPIPFPSPPIPSDEISRNIFQAVHPQKTLEEVFHSLAIKPAFHLVNRARVQLTTPLFPYLKAVGAK
jgi:SAM-dependent methyltransferase